MIAAMARVLCAWELGGGTGHLYRLAAVANGLRARGHEVVFALRDLARAAPILGGDHAGILQAPVWLHPSTLPPAANYAELLNRVGYLNAGPLATLTGAWARLLDAVAPDLLVADHAPTALLAARLAGLKRATVGTGFMIPPPVSPLPSIQPWQAFAPERLARAEAGVLDRVNRAVAALGGTPLSRLADIFEGCEPLLCTVAELDHYGPRAGARYIGPLVAPTRRDAVRWPKGDGPRVFVYYRARHAGFAALFDALGKLGARVVAVVDDADEAVIRRHAAPSVAITRDHLDLAAAAREARFAICHAGHGAVIELLRGGCPVLMLPVVVEQALLAHRAARAGLGVAVGARRPADEIATAVARMPEVPALAENARAFAARHAGHDPERAVGRVAERLEALAGDAIRA